MTVQEPVAYEWDLGRLPAPQITWIEALKLTQILLERGWCQHAEARSPTGRTVLAGAGMADRWCLRGALRAATRMLVHETEASDQLFIALYYHLQETLQAWEPSWTGGLESWNDQVCMTQERVLELVGVAIACLK